MMAEKQTETQFDMTSCSDDTQSFTLFLILLNHVHRHLRGGAILATITGCGHLLATAGISYHVHAVHAATG